MDVKGFAKWERPLRNHLPSASMNLGKVRVHVTMIPRLSSANIQKPIQATLYEVSGSGPLIWRI